MKPIASSTGLAYESVALVRQTCASNGLVLTKTQLNRLGQYAAILLTWNENVNLVSRSATHSVVLSHIIHSLSILFRIEIPPYFRMLDLGTGGGLPGIPISIARPDLHVTLVDSIGKKTAAVESILSQLCLKCDVLNSRAEALAKTYPAFFDIVISRAVAPLSDLITWSRPLLAITNDIETSVGTSGKVVITSGSLIAMKGGDLQLEIDTAGKKTGEKKINTYDLSFPGAEELGVVDKKLVVVKVCK